MLKSSRGSAPALALLSFFAFGLISCSTPTKTDVATPMASAQTEIDTPSKPSVSLSRYVASVDEDELEIKFKAMLAAEFPGKEISGEIRRLAAIYYKAEGLLRDYDAKLDTWVKDADSINASVLNTDDTYAQLLAARILTEDSVARIGYYQTRILETMHAADGAVSDKDRATAKRLYDDMRKALFRLGRATDKLALKSLVLELYEIRMAFFEKQSGQATGRSRAEKPPVADSVDWELSSQKRVEKFYAKNKKALDSAIEESNKNTELQAEIGQIAASVRADLVSSFSDREPQSDSVVAPGSGSSGNMTGNNYKTGRWSLTYDDGPSGKYTQAILDNLVKRGLKASFFELAKNVVALPQVVKRVGAGGHDLANHSYSHPQLTKLGSSGLKKEINESTAVETKYFGEKPKLFRCPYGACGGNGSTIRKMIAAQGMIHVFWNVDSLDWQDKNATSVYKRIKKQMAVQKRGIILCHDIHPQTVEATRMLMDDFVKAQKDGSMRVLTVEQAVKELNGGGMK